jgi:regulator of protease activity HflC (stomatin/prohibitin superfamily)
MTSTTDWETFDPGFDHGQVELRKSNIDGVFSASKISAEGLVLGPNITGQIGSEAFEWDKLEASKSADVRGANLRGQILGADDFDWSSVDPTGETVRKPNLPQNLDSHAFDGIDLAAMGTDVRRANCDGVIGDADFIKLVAREMTPLTPVQTSLRLAILPLLIAVPAGLCKPIMAAAPTAYGPPIAGALLAIGAAFGVFTALKKIVMVKQGQLCFAQYFENGATHVLQSGVHLLASFGTTTRFFDVKQDTMQFGTVSFVRVRPGFIGTAVDNGKPVLLLPGQHLYNNANFSLQEIKSISDAYISNGPMHIIRVSQGYLGLVSVNKRPIILESGLHFVNDPGFEMKRAPRFDKSDRTKEPSASVNDVLIENGPISIIRVTPGNIGLATSSKQPVLLGAGLHFIKDPSFEWQGEKDVTTKVQIKNGPISIVRVIPGHVGLATINKSPIILDTGMHIVIEPTFELVNITSINEPLIEIGPVKVIRVGPGEIGVATLNGRPLLLDVGVHFVNEPSFTMDGDPFRRQDMPHFAIGPVNVLNVPRGKIVPVVVNGVGHFLLEGRHMINQARFSLKSPTSLSDEYVSAGTRHRIIVPRGKLGLALEKGEPVVYEPGSMHLVNSEVFEYKGSVDVTSQVITHGSLKIVYVKSGQVGISYNSGVLELLQTGRHHITAETHTLAGFVSTGQQTLRISEVTGMTLDNVELTFDAAICIRVVDAQKAITMLATSQGGGNVVEEMFSNVQERAKLDLCTIIGKNRFNKKHAATTTHTAGDGKAAEGNLPDPADGFETVDPPPAAAEDAGFRSAVHDSFMVLFKEEMFEKCGVEVLNMAVEDARIVDQELAKSLAAAAVANSALEKQNIEAEIVQVKAAAEAKVVTIEAEGKASAMKVLSRAEADRIKTTSDALEKACTTAQQNETIRISGQALNEKSTVVLAQDMNALAGTFGFRKFAH